MPYLELLWFGSSLLLDLTKCSESQSSVNIFERTNEQLQGTWRRRNRRRKGKKGRGRGEGVGGGGLEERQVGKRVKVALVVRNPAYCCRRLRFDPWRREQQPTPVFLLGESHGQRSLAGSWGCRVGHNWVT